MRTPLTHVAVYLTSICERAHTVVYCDTWVMESCGIVHYDAWGWGGGWCTPAVYEVGVGEAGERSR